MSKIFRCVSQAYEMAPVVETRRTSREVAVQDARLLRSVTGRPTWVEDSDGKLVSGRRPYFAEDEGNQDSPLGAA